MIPYHKALETVLAHIPAEVKTETCDITKATGRILAAQCTALRDIPPYNRVAVDGYACRREDLGSVLEIVETVPAGYVPKTTITKGTCIKIMTGAILPAGAECVFMVEDAELPEQNRVRFIGSEKAAARKNYAPQGEDKKCGDILIPKGTRIEPKHIASLAAQGYAQVPVATPPLVGILATGDELVEPAQHPQPHQIINSNSYQTNAQLVACGVRTKYYGIIKDNAAALTDAVRTAQAECDVIILSGGVSMGDFDLVPQALTHNGYKILFDQLLLKPGKPTTFAISEKGAAFGLPGNPVAVFMVFELLVKPYVYALMGHHYIPRTLQLPLGVAFKQADASREALVQVKIEHNTLFPLRYNGSGDYSALGEADGIVAIPAGVERLEQGTLVHVRLI